MGVLAHSTQKVLKTLARQKKPFTQKLLFGFVRRTCVVQCVESLQSRIDGQRTQKS